MQEYNIWQAEFEHKLIVIVGDLGKSQLGMSEENFERLAIQSSVVFHLGAHVNFTQPYSFHRPANVLGMLEILRFSRTGRVKALHYVSTLSAYGPTRAITGTTFLHEDEPPLRHLNAVSYDIGYSQSKWVAEQLVWSEISRGFPICIYRPGFVLGHSITGTLNKNDFISRLITSSIDSGFFPLLPDEYKEFIPVDFVTNSILHISSFAGNIGHAYNLVPERRESLDLISTLRLLGQYGGYNLQGISYKEWVDKVRQNQADSMHPFLPLLEENVYQDLTLWELYRDLAVYDTANTQSSLQALSQPTKPPPLDGNLIMLYLKMWTKR
ncbi:hypothetical protein OCU04_005737 [Sclerotinia nivalis]|uniref:Thioester reductase (TE) domain-containing protein n=1 Tax=Sclerotinia nivalis TaxID=352851 RepID=A0A9X0AQP8_9HELO|nr:hypothetical protein OCU04_005737 [Sclerotinia nivalis]